MATGRLEFGFLLVNWIKKQWLIIWLKRKLRYLSLELYSSALSSLFCFWKHVRPLRCWPSPGPSWVVISLREQRVCHLWRFRPAYIALCLPQWHTHTHTRWYWLSGSCISAHPWVKSRAEEEQIGAAFSARLLWNGHRRSALNILEPCLLSLVAKGNFPPSVFYSDAHILR